MTDTESAVKVDEKGDAAPVGKVQESGGEGPKAEVKKQEAEKPPVANGLGNGETIAEEGKGDKADIDEALSSILETADQIKTQPIDETKPAEETKETTEESKTANEKVKTERGGYQNKNTKRNNKIIIKGFPLDKYVRDISALQKLIVDLFVEHLKMNLPVVRAPTWGDRWLRLDMKNQEDKAKAVTDLQDYKWEEYSLTVQDYANRNRLEFGHNLGEEDVVVNASNVINFFLKYRNMPYKNQLEMKNKRTHDAVADVLDHLRDANLHISGYINHYPPIIEETVPSLHIDGYSIDSYFHILLDKESREKKIGIKVFNHKASYIVPVSECLNIPRQMKDLANSFFHSLELLGLKVYDDETEEGDVIGISIQMNFIGQMLLTVNVIRDPPPASSEKKKGVEIKEEKDVEEKKDGGDEEEKKEAEGVKKEGGEEEKKDDKMEVEKKEDEKKEEEKKEDKKEEEKKEDKKEEEKKEDKKEEEKKEDKKEEEKKEDKKEEEKKEDKKEEEKEKKEEEKKEERTEEEKKEGEEEKMECGEGEETKEESGPPKKPHIAAKDLKALLMDFYKTRGQDLGCESIYYKNCHTSHKRESGTRQNEYVRVIGPTCINETLGGITFMINPERIWAPNSRCFEGLLSVVERLGRIGPDTTVVSVSTDHRFLPLYLAKKCKEVIALGCWNMQTSYNAKRIADSKGCRNTEFSNVTGKLPASLYRVQPKSHVVVVFWDSADSNVLEKLLSVGCSNFIDVMTSEKRFGKNMFKHIMTGDLRIAPTVVVPVDSHPHTDRFALVVKFTRANPSPNLSGGPGGPGGIKRRRRFQQGGGGGGPNRFQNKRSRPNNRQQQQQQPYIPAFWQQV